MKTAIVDRLSDTAVVVAAAAAAAAAAGGGGGGGGGIAIVIVIAVVVGSFIRFDSSRTVTQSWGGGGRDPWG